LVINYYNQYKVNGKSVNGKKTVSENIADLGAVSCVVDIAKSKGATDEELKEMFEAYANIWASKSTEEYTKLLLIMDTHSPDKVRVNAVLSSIEEFYRVYNIIEDDEMYRVQEERIKVW
jgi:putative endopeptidase